MSETSNLPKEISNSLYGGAERDRTADPLLAKQVLSQLSYSPLVTSNPNFESRICNYHGAVAQLGEHLLCKQGVSGSIPLSSTN